MSEADAPAAPATDIPTRSIHHVYQECLEARKQFYRCVAAGNDPDLRQFLHQELHATTLSLFEVLYPFLEELDSLDRYWDEVPLWTNSEAVYNETTRNVEIRENTVTGLRHLESWFGRISRQKREVTGHMGTRTTVEENAELLTPQILFRVGRYLDEVLKDLGLLANVKEGEGRTEIDEGLLKEVKEWEATNVSQDTIAFDSSEILGADND